MGLKEIRTYYGTCISRLVIVALSAQRPGVDKLCVYILSSVTDNTYAGSMLHFYVSIANPNSQKQIAS
jgi:hypothetical protein